LTIILAAGEGTRMMSSMPKVLHQVAGLAMVGHVLNTAREAGCDKSVVVVGASADRVEKEVLAIDDGASVAIQHRRLGTGHAVLAAEDWLSKDFDHVLVLYGDVPLIRAQTLTAMREKLDQGAALVVLGFEAADPTGYGRMLTDQGKLIAIREHKDATDEEQAVTFCNGGIMAFQGATISAILNAIENNNAQKEYYLTDAVEVARARGLDVRAMEVDENDIRGVNNRVQLAEVEAIWQSRKRREMMLNGVSLSAPDTVIFSHDTAIGRDCTVEPYVVFASGVRVSDNVIIKAFSHLDGADIADGCTVGPYARLRPGTKLLPGARVGNFCETKKSTIGAGAKVNHLSYIGDTTIGKSANIGAGTITCNYDGINKHQTEIGDNAFVGSNSSLVAPVQIGNNAIIAAGSVVTRDVPANALGIGRGKQVNKDELATKIRDRNAAVKKSNSDN